MKELNRERAKALRQDLSNKFNVHFDRVLNFTNYNKTCVVFKLWGKYNDGSIFISQGSPAHPISYISIKDIVDLITTNYIEYQVSVSYPDTLKIPHVSIRCNQVL